MISAKTAKENVLTREAATLSAIQNIVDEILESMSKSIEYYSNCGLSRIEFAPYNNSRFSNDYAKEQAYKMFEKTFKDNGYIILLNDIRQNCLKIQW